MPLELWIPETAREKVEPDLLCTVPDCTKRFPASQRQQWMRHVTAHVRKEPEQIEELVHQRDSDGVLTPIDKELAEWIRKRKANGTLPKGRF